jgi:FaeA-like protein
MPTNGQGQIGASSQPQPQAPPPASGMAGPLSPLEETLQVFERWLLLKNHTPILATLGTVAANMLAGDPVWLGLVGPSSCGKTEILDALSELSCVALVSTLTLPGLLSGTPQQQRSPGATGGLLRQVGNPGIIVCKEFSSILFMRPDTRTELLNALREIYDGRWIRHIGSGGGKVLTWSGKVGFLFGCTEAIDAQHDAISNLGHRFLYSRVELVRQGHLKKAIKHRGAMAAQMRKELADAVSKLFAQPRQPFQPMNEQELNRLDDIVSLVVDLRGGSDRDPRTRELETVYSPEGPSRIGLALEQLFSGLIALGLDRARAFTAIITVAMDSTPPKRRRIYSYLQSLKPNPGSATTSQIAAKVKLPALAVRRTLEELEAHGRIERLVRGRGRTGVWQAL